MFRRVVGGLFVYNAQRAVVYGGLGDLQGLSSELEGSESLQ
jgi:hypothetical protein